MLLSVSQNLSVNVRAYYSKAIRNLRKAFMFQWNAFTLRLSMRGYELAELHLHNM